MSRILVVDDEAGVREFVAEALELDGFEALAVASGDAALALLQQRSYELMFTDLKMPGIGGLELLARAKELQPELEVIVLTAQASATSQLALPKPACDEVFARTGYEASVSNLKNMSISTDNVFSDGADLETPVMTGSASEGFLATLSVTV